MLPIVKKIDQGSQSIGPHSSDIDQRMNMFVLLKNCLEERT